MPRSSLPDDITVRKSRVTASVQRHFCRPKPRGWRSVGPFRDATHLSLPIAPRRRNPTRRGIRLSRRAASPVVGHGGFARPGGLVPEEGLTPKKRCDCSLLDAATAIGEEGSLDPGAPASFTILDDDPVTATGRAPHDGSAWSVGGRGLETEIAVPGEQWRGKGEG